MITNNIPFYCQPGRINISPYKSLRIKVTDRCPFTCNFCHHEGSSKSRDLIINKLLKTALLKFIHELKITEVHLTGGEPTFHRELSDLIKLITHLGLEAKMTSNGQFDSNLLNELKESGLKSINISVHTLDSIKLGQIMKPKRDENWGKKALNRQLANLVYAREIGLKSKINTVVQSDSDISSVIDFCKKNQVDLRILDDLNPGSLSVPKIVETLTSMEAIVTGMNLTDKASGFSFNIESSDGFKFKVKAIRKNVLKSLCNGCDMRDSCKEWFYGIRLEQAKEALMVRLCLHRQDYPAKQKIHEFFSSDQFLELANL